MLGARFWGFGGFGLYGFGVLGVLGCMVLGFWGFWIVWFWGFGGFGLYGFGLGLWGFGFVWFWGFGGFGVVGFWGFGGLGLYGFGGFGCMVLGFWVVLGFWCTDFGVRSTGICDFRVWLRILGFRRLGFSPKASFPRPSIRNMSPKFGAALSDPVEKFYAFPDTVLDRWGFRFGGGEGWRGSGFRVQKFPDPLKDPLIPLDMVVGRWEFPKIRGTLFGGPHNKDLTI